MIFNVNREILITLPQTKYTFQEFIPKQLPNKSAKQDKDSEGVRDFDQHSLCIRVVLNIGR